MNLRKQSEREISSEIKLIQKELKDLDKLTVWQLDPIREAKLVNRLSFLRKKLLNLPAPFAPGLSSVPKSPKKPISKKSKAADPLWRFHERERKRKALTALKNLRKARKVNKLTKQARDRQNSKTL